MGENKTEREINRLLEQNGAILKRQGKHMVWELPQHRKSVTVAKTGSDVRGLKNSLADLRRALGQTAQDKVQRCKGMAEGRRCKLARGHEGECWASHAVQLEKRVQVFQQAEPEMVEQAEQAMAPLPPVPVRHRRHPHGSQVYQYSARDIAAINQAIAEQGEDKVKKAMGKVSEARRNGNGGGYSPVTVSKVEMKVVGVGEEALAAQLATWAETRTRLLDQAKLLREQGEQAEEKARQVTKLIEAAEMMLDVLKDAPEELRPKLPMMAQEIVQPESKPESPADLRSTPATPRKFARRGSGPRAMGLAISILRNEKRAMSARELYGLYREAAEARGWEACDMLVDSSFYNTLDREKDKEGSPLRFRLKSARSGEWWAEQEQEQQSQDIHGEGEGWSILDQLMKEAADAIAQDPDGPRDIPDSIASR